MKTDFDWKNPTWTNLFITLPWGIGLLAAVLGWSADHEIAKRERMSVGVITGQQSGRVIQYHYTFSADGKTLEGSNSSDERRKIGEQVEVFYDPADPSKNALVDYKDLAIRNFGLAPWLLTVIGGVAWYIWYTRSRDKPVSE